MWPSVLLEFAACTESKRSVRKGSSVSLYAQLLQTCKDTLCYWKVLYINVWHAKLTFTNMQIYIDIQ